MTNNESFINIINWLHDLEEYGPKHISTVLVGNKADLTENRTISTETAENLADQYKLDYIEVSALSGENVKRVFEVLCKKMMERQDLIELRKSKISLKSSFKSSTSKSKNNDIDYAQRVLFETEEESLNIKLKRKSHKRSNCCNE